MYNIPLVFIHVTGSVGVVCARTATVGVEVGKVVAK